MIPASWLYRILGAALAAAALLWVIQSRDHWRDRARSNEQLYLQAKAAHAATVANYRAAADQARREDAANVARVEEEQARINERTRNDFENRIASARAAAQRLREQAASSATHSSAGGAASVPGLSSAPGAAAQAAGQDGLSPDDALIATEQAIQLDELIKWVSKQHLVTIGRSGDVMPAKAGIPE